MKSVKLMTLGLAGLMSFQHVALANSSRIEGIGEAQAMMARHELRSLKRSMLALDQALEQTEKQMKDRKTSGRVFNGISIVAAGISVAAVAYSSKMLLRRSEGAILESTLAAVGGLVTGAASVSAGSLTSLSKETVEVSQLKEELLDSQFALDSQIALETDKERIAVLESVKASFAIAATNLEAFERNQTQEDQRLFYTNLAQGAATFLTFVSLATGNGGAMGLMNLGVGGTGLARIVVGLQGNNAEEVLKEISKTRTQLQSALAEL